MGLTVSYRHEGCTQTEAAGRIRHALRDVEEQKGLYRQHSNELIDPSRTATNCSFAFETQADGSVVKKAITDVKDVSWKLRDRLATVQNWRTTKSGKRVPVKIRSDASVAVELLFQLDPEWTGSCEDMTAEKRAEIQRLYEAFYDHLLEKWGPENILAVSEHWDETSPHVQAFVVPITETGELSVKEKLTGMRKPTRTQAREAYAKTHDELRERLRGLGYDATKDRVTPARAHNVRLDAFKRVAERATAEEREAVSQRASELDTRAAKVSKGVRWVKRSKAAIEKEREEQQAVLEWLRAETEWERAQLTERERKVAAKEDVLEARSEFQDNRAAELDERERKLEGDRNAFSREQKAADERTALRNVEALRVYRAAAVIDRTLAALPQAVKQQVHTPEYRQAKQYLDEFVASRNLVSEQDKQLE